MRCGFRQRADGEARRADYQTTIASAMANNPAIATAPIA
jgi:hypothetical protein